MSREIVTSPDDVHGGDRVEVEGRAGIGGAPFHAVVDLLYRDGDWWGVIAAVSADGILIEDGTTGKDVCVRVGWRVVIRRFAFRDGSVCVRRRSRETLDLRCPAAER